MPESSPSGDPTGSAGAPSRASGEDVHEQTVRTSIPMPPASETTVRVPMPTAPPEEQTVRTFVPSAVPAALEVDDLEEVDVEPEAEASAPGVLDVSALVSELEANVRHSGPEADVPVARADQVTAPETAAEAAQARRKARRDARRQAPSLRSEPPAVSGEVSVSEPEPGGIFDPAPARREDRPRAARGTQPAPMARREDPPVVSGEVAVDPSASHSPQVVAGDVLVMTSAAPQPMMTSSGSHPIMLAVGPQPMMASSGSHPIMLASGSQPVMTASGASPVVPRRSSTEPGYAGAEITGPQPRSQAEPTGPHPVMSRRGSSRDSLVLWTLAGALVVLALGVVMMVISWSR